MNEVAAIIVCFFPNLEKLKVLIEIIEPSVCEIILYNNGGLNEAELDYKNPKIKIKSLGLNVGIGAALNTGCDLALANGSRFAVTFDQDSIPEKNMIPILVTEILRYQAINEKAIAIGPQLVDIRGDKNIVSSFIRFNRFGSEKWNGKGVQPVSQLITSGCLIDLKIWKSDNRFDDQLFIDLIDHSWCWKMARKGYVILGTTNTKMLHELSEKIKTTKGYSLTTYGATRRYYQVRNSFFHLLYQPLTWAQKFYVVRIIAAVFISSVLSDKKPLQSVRCCLRGFADGVVGRLGAYRE
ncbi:MAG: glycosyltransferase family 2 protein [Burkholderiales bacterium]|nr:glycosyltransferase family 2 protein [Burkholderiales bacterium]